MKIKLISQDQHDQLLNIYNNHPALTLQNKGYEYIRKDSLSNEDKHQLKEVQEILKQSIVGFSSFSNFRIDKNNEIQMRIQYDYGAEDEGNNPHHFTGVGYILLDELLNGFRDN